MTKPLALSLSGMTCQNCVKHVRRALDGIEGVEIESVDIGKADLLIDDSLTNAAAIGAVLAEAGYPVATGGPNLTQIR